MNIDNYIKDLFDVFENKNASDSEKKHAIYFFAHQIADMQKELKTDNLAMLPLFPKLTKMFLW